MKYCFLLLTFYISTAFYNNVYIKQQHSLILLAKKTKPYNYENKKTIIPKSTGQEKYCNDLENENLKILLGIGPAGTGKTFLACHYAINMLNLNKIDKIILTRPIVSVDEALGFLPGNLQNKMDPWTRPLFDALKDSYPGRDISIFLKNEIIEICPLAYMRGRTFKNCLIIADEMQNSTPNQMYMLTSRLGTNSRLIITGDLYQSDIKGSNGLIDITSRIQKYKTILYNNNEDEFINNMNIKVCLLKKNDIQRSKIVSNIINLYDTTNN